MKKNELHYGWLVRLDNELVKVVDIGVREVLVETERGRRKYTNAGSLSRPSINITVPLEIEIEADEGLDWHVSCPHLRGFHTMGKTFKECLRNAEAAGKGFLLSTIKHYNEEH